MLFARRLTMLRIATLVAVVASAILVVDSVKPGRQFCPLEQACSAAAQSELGSIAGIPTSMLGLGAFLGVLLATLLPVRIARTFLQPVCFVGALIAMALIAYQAMYLASFCPLCLVADGAAIVMGYLALTWPPLPVLRSGRRLYAENQATRMAWVLAAGVAVIGPFAWPREEDKGWEEAPVMAEALFEDAAPDADLHPALPPAPEAPASPTLPVADADPEPGIDEPRAPVATPAPMATTDTMATVTVAELPEAVAEAPAPAAAAQEAPTAAAPVESPLALPTPPAPARAPERAPEPAPQPEPGVRIIEYLNAFCAHCRATHKRLEALLEEGDVAVERRRVYTWKGDGCPLWARACAYAAELGREDAMFRELTRARRETVGEVYAAAQRAGIDGPEFRRAMGSGEPPPRLVRDKRIAQAARLTRLPTFDIGRRRLSGSQSERELRAALEAATRDRTPADG